MNDKSKRTIEKALRENLDKIKAEVIGGLRFVDDRFSSPFEKWRADTTYRFGYEGKEILILESYLAFLAMEINRIRDAEQALKDFNESLK